MSLCMYIGEDNFPENDKFIRDVEGSWYNLPVIVDDFSKEVIKKVDKGQLIDDDTFIDRFGYKLYLSECSTTSKILLAVNSTDYIVNGDELGENGEELLLNLKHGNIYFTCRTREFACLNCPVDIICNGIKCSKLKQVDNIICELNKEDWEYA